MLVGGGRANGNEWSEEGIQHLSTAKTVASCLQSCLFDLKTMIPLSFALYSTEAVLNLSTTPYALSPSSMSVHWKSFSSPGIKRDLSRWEIR